jgi:membrane associated rhomboid family serine protease
MKSMYAPSEGMHISPITIYIFVGYLFLCLTGLFDKVDAQGREIGVANVAHFAGLAVGIVAGYAPILLKPRTGT